MSSITTPAPARPPGVTSPLSPSRRPVVGHLLPTLNVGGAELLARVIANRLSDRYRFAFFSLAQAGAMSDVLTADGHQVCGFDKRPGVDPRAVWAFRRTLARSGVQLLHAHQYPAYFYATAARALGARVPILFTEHGRDYPDFRRRKRVIYNRLTFGRRDRAAAVGVDVRRALVEYEGFPAGRVGVVYNGVAVAQVGDREEARAEVRREFGVGEREIVVLQAARLDRLKDHATALRAFRGVLRTRPDTRLLLAGDGPERLMVEQLTAELGLGQHVRFLSFRSDVPRLLAGADVALLTSISEGIPLALIEAMASGVPVVATAVGGVPEVVADGTTGLLAPAGDADALARHILTLAAAPDLRARFGAAGRQRATDRFSEDRMTAAYDELYRSMLPRPAAARR